MKSCRQLKRKRIEINRKQDECMGVTVKKSANGPGGGSQEAAENIRMPCLEPPIQLQVPSGKIKLQLFPINEQTRLGLEKVWKIASTPPSTIQNRKWMRKYLALLVLLQDGYNPFLELTLSARKRISSVVRHLITKWSCSNTVIGHLMLFPYNTKLEELASCRRWTSNDSVITAWEVYVDVGSPSIFRLRYGWFSNLQPEMFDILPKSSPLEAHTGSAVSRRGWPRVLEMPNHQDEQINESCETIKKQINMNEALDSDVSELKSSNEPTDFVDDELTNEVDPVRSTVPWDDNLTNLSIGGLLSEISLQGKFNGLDPNSVNKSDIQPIGLISDISIGDLLSEASLLGKMSNPSMKLENESSLQPIFLPSSDVSIGGLLSEASLLSKKNKLDAQKMEKGHAQIQSPWDDTFTTLSIGGLLSEVSLQAKAGRNPELKGSKSSLEPSAPLSHSDSLISSQPYTHSQMLKPSCHEPNLSILDAEETCHAFPIRKFQPSRDATTSDGRVSSSRCSTGTSSKQSQFPEVAKANNETVFPKDSSFQEPRTNPLPHSLGAFDEDSGLCFGRHQSE